MSVYRYRVVTASGNIYRCFNRSQLIFFLIELVDENTSFTVDVLDV